MCRFSSQAGKQAGGGEQFSRLALRKGIALEVTFELTLDDLWQYALYHRRQKSMLRTILLYGFAILISVTCVTGFWGIIQAVFRHHTLDWAGLLLLIFMAFCVPRIWPPTKKRLVKLQPQQPDIIGPHRVSIDQSWFFEETLAREIKYTWRSFESVEENQRYFFLFLSKNVAFLIPKRAFPSPHEAQTFLDTTRRYWSAAKNGTPVTAEDAAVWPPAPRPGA